MPGVDVAGLLVELYGRIPPLARAAVRGLDQAQLTRAPEPGCNSIGWLIWHLTRVQDHHLGEVLDTPQLWTEGDWPERFAQDGHSQNIGYGHTAEQAASVRPESADALVAYLDAVQRRTVAFLETLQPADLDRIVDRRWDPPVTLGVRLVSVADDSLQHAGQAAYLRGLFGF